MVNTIKNKIKQRNYKNKVNSIYSLISNESQKNRNSKSKPKTKIKIPNKSEEYNDMFFIEYSKVYFYFFNLI